MILLSVWLGLWVSGAASRAPYEYTDERGVLHAEDGWALRCGGSIIPVVNLRHPERAPPNLIQTWTVKAYPDGAIRLQCTDLYVPKRVDGLCTDYKFTITDGADNQTMCGSLSGLSFLSNTKEITITLTTGDQAAAKVQCRVQAREMGPDGEVTDPPPTPSGPVWPPKFTTIPSEEVDSAEHGGPPGPVPTTCPCGAANKNLPRIIAGEETKANEFPFAALLTYRGEEVMHFCGGSLITPWHVITAAHCLRDKDSNSIAAIVGEHNYIEGPSPHSKKINVREIVIHEMYAQHKHYDIALLVLETPAPLDRFVSLACLPSKRLHLGHNYLTAMGWGRVGWGKEDYTSVFLKKMKVRAIPLDECSLHAGVTLDDPHQLCTYGSKRGLGQGDSGGPVVWLDPDTNRYTIVGLPSFVYPFTGQNYLPDVTTDVSSFLPWIHRELKRTVPSTNACWSTQ